MVFHLKIVIFTAVKIAIYIAKVVCVLSIFILFNNALYMHVCLFVLFDFMPFVPVNSYGHVGTSPPIVWDLYPTFTNDRKSQVFSWYLISPGNNPSL